MKIAVASDHAGLPLKETVIKVAEHLGHEVQYLGTDSQESVDYPDFAEKVGRLIQLGEVQRGIILCGSGVGACITANKMKGVYACVCHDTYSAHQAVEHDEMNVLCLGARVIGAGLAVEIITTYLSSVFTGHLPGEERHARRVGKIKEIENGSFS